MKKPKITKGQWESPEVMPTTVISETGKTVGEGLNPPDAQAIAALPDLIEEGIKALDKLHSFYYDNFTRKGYSHDAAENMAQLSTESLFQSLKKAGVKKDHEKT